MREHGELRGIPYKNRTLRTLFIDAATATLSVAEESSFRRLDLSLTEPTVVSGSTLV